MAACRLPVCLLALLLLAGCGDGAPAPTAGAGGPVSRPLVGQEIWISYFSPQKETYGLRTSRSAGDAKNLADQLRKRVLAGEDVGRLAREYSNAPFASADGFTGVLPRDEARPTSCDRALAAAGVGDVTPVLDFRGGYWFARRIAPSRARDLEALLLRELGLRARFSSIALLYRGAWIPDPGAREKITRTKEAAIDRAEAILEKLRQGEAFDALANRYSEDASYEDGGLVHVLREGGVRTSWVRRQEAQIPKSVLDVVFDAEVGKVHPEVIVSPRGVFLVKVEERRVFPPGEAP